MNVHPGRVSGKARHCILVAQSLIFLVATPERLLSQTSLPEPMPPQMDAPSDQVPNLLPEENAEPVAPLQNLVPLANVTEDPVRPEATPLNPVNEVKTYLWGVYQRSS